MQIYTDGACSYNPGPGGYAVVALDDNEDVVWCHTSKTKETTNNREELTAILVAVKEFGPCSTAQHPLEIYSDSSYAINTYSNWMFNWERNGWIKSDKKVPENLDIIKEYYNLIKDNNYNITFHHIRGHRGIKGNEIADKLASGRLTVDEVVKKYGSADYKIKYCEEHVLYV